MKLFALTAGLAACAIALPAAAQSMTVAPTEGAAPAAWWNPMGYAHDSYVEVDGGTTFEGRVKRMSTAEGVEPSSRSAKLSGDVFASALVGHNLTPSIAFELEGIYMRDHYNYTTPALAAIGDRARREYGGLGNVKLSSPYVAHLRQFAIVPYIAGGIGYGNVEYDSSTSRGGDRRFHLAS